MATITYTFDNELGHGILTVHDGLARGSYPFGYGTRVEAGRLCLGTITLQDGRVAPLKIGLDTCPGLTEQLATARTLAQARDAQRRAADEPAEQVRRQMRHDGLEQSGNAGLLWNTLAE